MSVDNRQFALEPDAAPGHERERTAIACRTVSTRIRRGRMLAGLGFGRFDHEIAGRAP